MTFVKVKLALSSIAAGDLLNVALSEGEPLQNVPRAALELGHRIVEIKKETMVHHVIIEKRLQ
jgi:TusA-related sulfurtransferase